MGGLCTKSTDDSTRGDKYQPPPVDAVVPIDVKSVPPVFTSAVADGTINVEEFAALQATLHDVAKLHFRQPTKNARVAAQRLLGLLESRIARSRHLRRSETLNLSASDSHIHSVLSNRARSYEPTALKAVGSTEDLLALTALVSYVQLSTRGVALWLLHRVLTAPLAVHGGGPAGSLSPTASFHSSVGPPTSHTPPAIMIPTGDGALPLTSPKNQPQRRPMATPVDLAVLNLFLVVREAATVIGNDMKQVDFGGGCWQDPQLERTTKTSGTTSDTRMYLGVCLATKILYLAAGATTALASLLEPGFPTIGTFDTVVKALEAITLRARIDRVVVLPTGAWPAPSGLLASSFSPLNLSDPNASLSLVMLAGGTARRSHYLFDTDPTASTTDLAREFLRDALLLLRSMGLAHRVPDDTTLQLCPRRVKLTMRPFNPVVFASGHVAYFLMPRKSLAFFLAAELACFARRRLMLRRVHRHKCLDSLIAVLRRHRLIPDVFGGIIPVGHEAAAANLTVSFHHGLPGGSGTIAHIEHADSAKAQAAGSGGFKSPTSPGWSTCFSPTAANRSSFAGGKSTPPAELSTPMSPSTAAPPLWEEPCGRGPLREFFTRVCDELTRPTPRDVPLKAASGRGNHHSVELRCRTALDKTLHDEGLFVAWSQPDRLSKRVLLRVSPPPRALSVGKGSVPNGTKATVSFFPTALVDATAAAAGTSSLLALDVDWWITVESFAAPAPSADDLTSVHPSIPSTDSNSKVSTIEVGPWAVGSQVCYIGGYLTDDSARLLLDERCGLGETATMGWNYSIDNHGIEAVSVALIEPPLLSQLEDAGANGAFFLTQELRPAHAVTLRRHVPATLTQEAEANLDANHQYASEPSLVASMESTTEEDEEENAADAPGANQLCQSFALGFLVSLSVAHRLQLSIRLPTYIFRVLKSYTSPLPGSSGTGGGAAASHASPSGPHHGAGTANLAKSGIQPTTPMNRRGVGAAATPEPADALGLQAADDSQAKPFQCRFNPCVEDLLDLFPSMQPEIDRLRLTTAAEFAAELNKFDLEPTSGITREDFIHSHLVIPRIFGKQHRALFDAMFHGLHTAGLTGCAGWYLTSPLQHTQVACCEDGFATSTDEPTAKDDDAELPASSWSRSFPFIPRTFSASNASPNAPGGISSPTLGSSQDGHSSGGAQSPASGASSIAGRLRFAAQLSQPLEQCVKLLPLAAGADQLLVAGADREPRATLMSGSVQDGSMLFRPPEATTARHNDGGADPAASAATQPHPTTLLTIPSQTTLSVDAPATVRKDTATPHLLDANHHDARRFSVSSLTGLQPAHSTGSAQDSAVPSAASAVFRDRMFEVLINLLRSWDSAPTDRILLHRLFFFVQGWHRAPQDGEPVWVDVVSSWPSATGTTPQGKTLTPTSASPAKSFNAPPKLHWSAVLQRLPWASTCTNTLFIPDYLSAVVAQRQETRQAGGGSSLLHDAIDVATEEDVDAAHSLLCRKLLYAFENGADHYSDTTPS